ncbi:flagellar biosynthetic protein FliR [Aromatoleum bremense]|uniref:Flagellar biosynthetic protein FliR n=1 Tax=Aromatoleum bremense TaxID=76115 RepID=A0ABX1NZL8_9RHOO|nr:flagellar biosynthetic protein FliR [Aromatoleum bremense]NMG17427.1 flagellar biosynthetic protein FliR [Aromatoleum bremense]QTQ30878.1 Flagellar biosynthetic protein [Aromatoleum bremense]
MISLTSAQLDAWIAALMFPLARLLGLVSAAPLFGNRMVPVRVRLAVGLAIAMAVLPALPPMPPVPGGSMEQLAIFAQQAFIGIAMGFVMRLVFAAVDVAGEMIGLQMGLSFAVFFSPQTGGQTSVIAEFLGLVALLVFVALDGHLMLVQGLVASFEWLPVGAVPGAEGWLLIVRYAAVMFASGLMMALPMVAALLITNTALGVLTRAAPQLNLFAVGFPVTLSVGFLVLLLSLDTLAPVLQSLFERGFGAIDELFRAFG